MNYQNGWTWIDDGETDIEQFDTPSNRAAIERLSNEARDLYNEIPEVRRRGYDDGGYSAEDARAEDMADSITTEFEEILTEEQLEEVISWGIDDLKHQSSEKKAAQFGQLEAIEQLMAQRGARFARPYEHWNEDEKFMEYSERDRDDEY